MKANDFPRIIHNILQDIGVELHAAFDENFDRQGFFSKKWQRRSREDGRKGRALLVDTGALRGSIRHSVRSNAVTFASYLPYARLHNDGGDIAVTARMKAYFWYKYREATSGRDWKRGEKENELAAFYKAMALQRVGKVIHMPQRRFIGFNTDTQRIVRQIIDESLTAYFTDLKL